MPSPGKRLEYDERLRRTAELLAQGVTRNAIAQRLGVTRGSVDSYIRKLQQPDRKPGESND